MAQDNLYYWVPRIMGIALVLFISLFALDVFDMGLSASEVMIALLMHLIPSLLLVLVLLVAWRYELVGGIIYILLGLAYSIMVVMNGAPIPWIVTIAGPVYVIGALFIENWRRKRSK